MNTVSADVITDLLRTLYPFFGLVQVVMWVAMPSVSVFITFFFILILNPSIVDSAFSKVRK